MRVSVFAGCVFAALALGAGDLKLEYAAPAGVWNEALPLGNAFRCNRR